MSDGGTSDDGRGEECTLRLAGRMPASFPETQPDSRLMPQLGAAPQGERLERIQGSPLFEGGKAQNLVPTSVEPGSEQGGALRLFYRFLTENKDREPASPLPIVRPEPASLRPDGRRLRVTWLGHSTMLIEIDGHLVLTDPVFARRVGPFSFTGPARFHEVPLPIEALPMPDVVLLSHDHYDHLDYEAILALNARGCRFVMPLGVGAHLAAWGVPEERITELTWWEEVVVSDLRLVCAPARHFSGRSLADRYRTLWCSWAMIGPRHSAWFSGDTGPFEAAQEIGARLGPFDLSMIEIGAWDAAWGNIHLGPDNAATMHQQVRAKVLMPVHWGTFSLAFHAWYQPIARMAEIAGEEGLSILSPLAGRAVRADEPAIDPFWLRDHR